MPEDHLERKIYRKSPGRQYGYEYDPLQSRSGRGSTDSTPSRSGMLYSQRPDPRRTRQLLRQNIIASKHSDDELLLDDNDRLDTYDSSMIVDRSRQSNDRSRPTRRIYHPPSERFQPAPPPIPRVYHAPQEEARFVGADPYASSVRGGEVRHPASPPRFVDPDLGIDEDEDLDNLESSAYGYEGYAISPQRAQRQRSPEDVNNAGKLRPPHPSTTRRLSDEPLEEQPAQENDEEYIFGVDEELPPGLHVVKKPSSSRRKFLIGAGIVAAGGIGVAAIASQANPKSPLGQVLNNTDQQVQDAYNQGAAQGAEQAKRELLTSLDNIENFTLQGAIDAARLTRVAYDVFVAPIVQFGATLTGDFLTGMLNAFKTARNWLAGVNQDNATLAAIQKVLESWVAQVQSLPKQLDAITQTDLDGAQAYLRHLQQKIQDDLAALNKPTPTPQVKSPTPTPKNK